MGELGEDVIGVKDSVSTFEDEEIVLPRKFEYFESTMQGGGHPGRITAIL